MGEIAEMMLDGTLCSSCGEYIGCGGDYPQQCPSCRRQRDAGEPRRYRMEKGGHSRSLLLFADLDAFAAWAERGGYRREPTPPKAAGEVLRLRLHPREAPIIASRRKDAAMVTLCERGAALVAQWRLAQRQERRRAMRAGGGR